MNHGDLLPDEHRIAIYLSGGILYHPAPAGSGIGPVGIRAAAFVLGAGDDHHSGHHWEHDRPVPTDEVVMRRIRNEADGDASTPIYSRRPNGRYGRFEVQSVTAIGYGIQIKKLEGDYPSHTGICGLEKMKKEDQLDIGKVLKLLVDRLFPAVTADQPRNDR